MTAGKVPDDAKLVVVASPKKDFSYAERDVMDLYFETGNAISCSTILRTTPRLTS